MLVKDVMTTNVITITPDTSIGDAQKIMKDNNFRRLPVVDSGGRMVGVVTETRLERVKPRTSAPLLW
ncbi:CBS domain-containing protein [Chloroflexota bacterium]